MISDARSIRDHRTLETHLCIVGAGPAGMSLAREFVGSSVDVCLLESGGLEPDADVDSLGAGEITGFPYGPLEGTRARRLGGTSHLWSIDIGAGSPGVRLRRLDPADFRVRDWVPYSGWPFGMDELLSFYERADVICGLGPLADYPDAQPEAFSGHALADSQVFEERLFRFGRRDRFTRTYRREIERVDNVTVYTYATVTRVETDRMGEQVTRVQVATPAGNTFSVRATAYVLAAGGIENARLLLVSDTVNKRGLGNEHDLVGRFFMEHPHLRTGIIVPADAEAIVRLPMQGIGRQSGEHFVERRLALRERVMREERLLAAAVTLRPTLSDEYLRSLTLPRRSSAAVASARALRLAVRHRRMPEDLTRHVAHLLSGMDDLAMGGIATLRWNVGERLRRLPLPGRFGRAGDSVFLAVEAMSEQAPSPESRLTLSNEFDRMGVRRVRLNWQLTALDFRTLFRTQQLLQDEVERRGLGKGYVEFDSARLPRTVPGGHHHMGTTRMDPDPRSGVVDEDCRIHGVTNLFVTGSSVFPTSGYANPTLTIVALAIRLADHLASVILGKPSGKETKASITPAQD